MIVLRDKKCHYGVLPVVEVTKYGAEEVSPNRMPERLVKLRVPKRANHGTERETNGTKSVINGTKSVINGVKRATKGMTRTRRRRRC